MAFTKGTKANFKRNSTIKGNDATIVFNGKVKGFKDDIIIIESSFGWIPDENRIKLFGLDKDKKYLFVQETELS